MRLWFKRHHIARVRDGVKTVTRRWWLHPRLRRWDRVEAVCGSRFKAIRFATLCIQDVRELDSSNPPDLPGDWQAHVREVYLEGRGGATGARLADFVGEFEKYFRLEFPRPSDRHKLYRVQFRVQKPLPPWPPKGKETADEHR